MKLIYFIRHGESVVNAEHIFGSGPDIELTEHGKAQASAVGDKLSREFPPIDVMISSTTKRTRQTAELIAATLNFPVDRIEADKRIIEINCGEFEGQPLTTENIHIRDGYFIEGKHEKGVESLDDIVARITDFVSDVRARTEDTILIIGHGFSGRTMRRIFANLPPTLPLRQMENATILQLYPYHDTATGEAIV